MTEEKRIGRQTPTHSLVLPYTQTLGNEAIALYNRSGRTAQEWQELMMYDIMAVNDEGLWTHMKFGWSIPRRNGKSELLIIRTMWALTHGERTLYTAHRTTTSHNAWEKVIERLAKAGFIEGEDFKTMRQYGLEKIEFLTDGGGVVNFRTRSSKGGLGEGYDLLIIDEAQEYTNDQESALKYVVTDSKNPQTLMCGTPPTAVSSGTVFSDYRTQVFTAQTEDCGFAEWSVSEMSDAHDKELWYLTNPSLGAILTERTIRSELGKDQTDDNIQRLGLWLRYNQKSAISRNEWEACRIEGRPKIAEDMCLCFGVKYAKGTNNVSLAVACKTADERIFIECIDCRPVRDGNDWIIHYLRNPHTQDVIIDGASGQEILTSDMANAGIERPPILPKVSEIIAANAAFEQDIFGGKIAHSGQPTLTQIASNCEHRAIGSSGGFGYTSILAGADISLLEAAALAHRACTTATPYEEQFVDF